MPNWCQTSMHIVGPRNDLRRFLNVGKSLPEYYYTYGWAEEERRNAPYFSLSGIYPIPEDVLRDNKTHSDIRERNLAAWREACQRIRDKNPGKEDEELELPGYVASMSPEFDQQSMDRWHSWSVEHWGTKWDIVPSAQIADDTDLDDPSIQIDFDTAWAPPIGWLGEAARQFPSLTFTLGYEELGMCFAGVAIAESGKLIKDECHDMTEAEMRARHPDWDWDQDEDAE